MPAIEATPRRVGFPVFANCTHASAIAWDTVRSISSNCEASPVGPALGRPTLWGLFDYYLLTR